MHSQKWFKWDPIVLAILIVNLPASAIAQETKTTVVPIPAAKEELLTELGSGFDKVGEAFWVFGNAGPDHLAYAAKRGKKWMMIADGKEGSEFVEVDSPRFSTDGQHLAYRAVSQRSGSGDREFIRWKMVVDSKEGPEFEELSLPVFSPDGQHLAYRGKRTPGTEAREVLILDGKEIKESEYASQLNEDLARVFDREGQPVFSPDGQHWAYRAIRKKNKEIILFDGKETTEFETLTKPVFSPDSRRLAYFAKREKKWHMILDGQQGPEIETAGYYGPVFSSDSQHLGYLSLRYKFPSAWEVSEIRDGKASGLHRLQNCGGQDVNLESPVLSPNGQKFAYVLWVGRVSRVGLAPVQYAGRCVVVDGQETKMYNDTQRIDIAFSPDSHHFAYAVHRNKKSMVVVDGQEGRAYDDVIEGAFRDIADSTDSTQHSFAYITREGHKFFRVTQPLP